MCKGEMGEIRHLGDQAMRLADLLWQCLGKPTTPEAADLPEDWQGIYEERAAIMEYHGELSRGLAEAKALEGTIHLMEDEMQISKTGGKHDDKETGSGEYC